MGPGHGAGSGAPASFTSSSIRAAPLHAIRSLSNRFLICEAKNSLFTVSLIVSPAICGNKLRLAFDEPGFVHGGTYPLAQFRAKRAEALKATRLARARKLENCL